MKFRPISSDDLYNALILGTTMACSAPTCMSKCQSRVKRTCPFLLEMHNVPHAQQVQAVAYICDRLPRFAGGAFDARGNGSYLAEAMVDRYGSIIEPVMPTTAWYLEAFPKYRAAFQDEQIALPRSDDIVEDHRAVRLVRGVPKLPEKKTDAKGDRHGDSAIAGVLAWWASEQDAGPVEGSGLPRRAGFGFEAARDDRERIDTGAGVVGMEGADMTGFE